MRSGISLLLLRTLLFCKSIAIGAHTLFNEPQSPTAKEYLLEISKTRINLEYG